MQFVSGPAGLAGRLFTDVQATRREGSDFDGLAQHRKSGVYQAWSDDGATRLAGEGGGSQYTAGGRVFGGAAAQAGSGKLEAQVAKSGAVEKQERYSERAAG